MKKTMILMAILFVLLTACDGMKTAPSTLPTVPVHEQVTQTMPTTSTTDMVSEMPPQEIKPEERFLPDSIFQRGCVTGNDNLTIRQYDRDTVRFTDGIGKDMYIDLTEKQIAQLSYLYGVITDYSNLPWLDTAAVDTVIQDNGDEYELCDIYTTQVELEQLLCCLNCLYRGVEYDWSVAPISDVFSTVEEERIGTPPPV